MLPDWIDAYKTYMAGEESPSIFNEWVAISTVAAAMQRKCFLRWKLHGYTYPNLYIVLVGPPAVGKGVAMGAASTMLREANVRTSANAVTRQALIQDLMSATESVDIDGSLYTHSSLTVFSKELAVFLGYNDYELISHMTDWFDCESHWVYKTIGRGDEVVENVFVNMIGATTPDIIQTHLPTDAVGGGLTSRIIFVFADAMSKIVAVPYLQVQDPALYAKMQHDLKAIAAMKGQFKVTNEFLELWVPWYINSRKNPMFGDGPLVRYDGRRAMHMLKICMVMNASRGDESMVIDAQDFIKAKTALDSCEQVMPKTFRGYGSNPLADQLPHIIDFLQQMKEVRKKDLIQKFVNELTLREIDEALNTLKTLGAVTETVSASGVYISINEEAIAGL